MTGTNRAAILALAFVGSAALGCPSKPVAPPLEGAVTDIPVYPKSRVVERIDYPSRGPHCALDTLIWDLESTDSPQKLEFFYRRTLTWVTPEEGHDADVSKVLFLYLPDGGETANQEQISISIDRQAVGAATHMRVKETVCAERRAAPPTG